MSRLLPRFGTWTCSRAQDVMKICSTTEIIIFFFLFKKTRQKLYMSAQHTIIEPSKHEKKEGKGARKLAPGQEKVTVLVSRSFPSSILLAIIGESWLAALPVCSSSSRDSETPRDQSQEQELHQVDFSIQGPCCHQIAVSNQTTFFIDNRPSTLFNGTYLVLGGIIPCMSALDSDATQ